MTGAHRDDTGQHQSLEEAILSNIDQAAAEAVAPAIKAIEKADTLKRFIVAVAVFGLIFGGAVSYALVKTNQALNETREVSERYRVVTCQAGNNYKVGDLARWTKILEISVKLPPGSKPLSPAKKAQQDLQIKQFTDYLKVVDAPTDCAKVVEE